MIAAFSFAWPDVLLAAVVATLAVLVIFRPWPHEVTEREPEAEDHSRLGSPAAASALIGGPSRSVTSLYDQAADDFEWDDAA